MKIYLSNIPFSMSEIQVKSLFEKFGEVHSVNLIEKDGKRAGYGFVVMDWRAGSLAVREIRGAVVGGRTLFACEAVPKGDATQRIR